MEYNYFWYHGGMRWSDVEAIEDAIDDKDFELFMKYRKKYPENLPKYISVFKDYDIVDHLDITVKDNFLKITYSEHENG